MLILIFTSLLIYAKIRHFYDRTRPLHPRLSPIVASPITTSHYREDSRMVIQAFSTFFHRPRLISKSIVTGSRAISTAATHKYIDGNTRYPSLPLHDQDLRQHLHLSDKQLEDIKEMLRLCPSSINSQPWAFELIGDRETKSLLAQHSYSNKERIEQASHLLVIYNYRDVATFEAERIATLSEGAQEFYRNKIASQGEASVLGWMRSQAYIALGIALTGLASMELDSTPMEGIDLEAYDQILHHDKYRPVLAIAIGKRSDDDSNQPTITPKQRRREVFL